jgi:peptidoglycan/xylan/chitin deacetylase (PgdA/CDA1 family)
MTPIANVKSIAQSISFSTGLSTAVAKVQSCGRIIMYHSILSRDAHFLEAQLRYLRRHFLIVSFERAIRSLIAGDLGKRNEIVLTFDDGLRNNATVAYPILRRLEIPATFFVCPGLIGTGKWLWTYEARCRLASLDEGTLSALHDELSITPTTIEGILEWMKTLGPSERQAIESAIRQTTPDFQATEDDREAYDMMDWNDIASLDPELITIGSHTVNHPILPTLNDREIDFEVAESRRQLEEKLDRPIKYFCYPNGSRHRQSCLAAKRTYEAAVTAENGMLIGKNSADLHLLPRIPSSRDAALMAWRLYRPEA